MNRLLLASVTVLLLCSGCDPFAGYGGKLTTPNDARVNLSDQTLSKFDEALSDVLFRYLAGNPRWEIREERGLRYAVRLERVDGDFETTLNGFYSTHDGGTVHQTRVLVSFGKPYGFGVEHGNVTRAKPGQSNVSVIIEGDHSGTPGNSSYTIVDGGSVFLEIYDQAPELVRTFTQATFDEVSAELHDVIAHRDSIKKNGILPVPKHYPEPLPQKSFFEVKDGMQPGIYLISAAVRPSESGYVYVKAFDTKTGARLSEDRMTPRSTRYLGWSDDGKTFFQYGSEVTVYEGDWSNKYEARFELWHQPVNGSERKLAETTRDINGWER